MNIRRYITALLLLFGCIISLSAAAVLYALIIIQILMGFN